MAEYNPSKIIKDGNTYNFRDTTKIPLAGSNAISGDLIPVTTDAYDLGGSSYQWNNAYIKSLTINGVACGDILTHNASEFVDVSSNQTIGGVKTFSDSINNKNVQQFIFNKEYNDATDSWLDIHKYLDKNSTRVGFHAIGDFSGNRGFRWFIRGQLTNSVEADIFGFGRKINETSYMYINATLETDLIPMNNNSKSLGSSTNKWKSLNGINPGALSLPSSTYINVDTTDWDLTCSNGQLGSFTPTADGWLMLHVANSGTSEVNFWVIGGVIRISNKSSISTTDNNNFNMITIPVEKDVTYNIYGNASEYVAGRSIAYCRFMPCRGNV